MRTDRERAQAAFDRGGFDAFFEEVDKIAQEIDLRVEYNIRAIRAFLDEEDGE